MGFDGILVSDWDAIKQLRGNFADQIETSVEAGVDVFMLPSDYGIFIDDTVRLVEEGRISEERIDDAVRRILKAKLELGLFEEPYADRTLIPTVGSDEHREIARQAVRESLVLLENEDGFLPLSTDSTVCINGSGADDLRQQAGGWTLGWQTASVEPEGTSIAAALTELVGDNVVEDGCDVGIRVVSETLGTYAEWHGDYADPTHDDSGSCEATDGCVVIIIAGRPVNIEALLDDPQTKAIVMAWYPGTEGGGVVDVIYAVDGHDFTGRLPLTWKVDDYDEPVNYCTASPLDTADTMAMCGDVGEHYTDAADAPPEVLFPYGYGLSY
jgi:beta-glucosidase